MLKQVLASKKYQKIYATFLANKDYLKGVLTLSFSLKKQKSKHPLFAFLTPDVSIQLEDKLKGQQILTRRIPKIPPPNLNVQQKRFLHVWSKLELWNQTDIKKIVFLDADTIVLKNIDNLFNVPLQNGIAMAPACVCNPEKKPNYPPEWKANICSFSSLKKPNIPFYGNSGVICLEPRANVYKDMMKEMGPYKNLSAPFPEQDFLNTYFKGKITPLHYSFNTLKTCLIHHSEVCHLNDVKVLHYIHEKPWNKKECQRYGPIHQIWNDAYHAYLKNSS